MVCSVIMISMSAAPTLVTMDPAMMLSTNTPALVTQGYGGTNCDGKKMTLFCFCCLKHTLDIFT